MQITQLTEVTIGEMHFLTLRKFEFDQVIKVFVHMCVFVYVCVRLKKRERNGDSG